MEKLVNSGDLKSPAFTGLRVRVPPWAPFKNNANALFLNTQFYFSNTLLYILLVMKKYNGEIILIDMDNSKVDFTKQFNALAQLRVPPHVFENRKLDEYWIQDSYGPEWQELLNEMVLEEGFFLNMEPMPGAIEAIKEMHEAGLDVIICTTPHPKSKYCINEKLEWIEKHLGYDYVKRAITSHDKTLITGHVLIDDKPEITGRVTNPTWKHVLFDAPYNQHIDTQYRMKNWSEWPEIIERVLKNPR